MESTLKTNLTTQIRTANHCWSYPDPQSVLPERLYEQCLSIRSGGDSKPMCYNEPQQHDSLHSQPIKELRHRARESMEAPAKQKLQGDTRGNLGNTSSVL